MNFVPRRSEVGSAMAVRCPEEILHFEEFVEWLPAGKLTVCSFS